MDTPIKVRFTIIEHKDEEIKAIALVHDALKHFGLDAKAEIRVLEYLTKCKKKEI